MSQLLGFITDSAALVFVAAAQTAAATDYVAPTIDTQGFSRALVFTRMPTDAANNRLTLQDGDAVAGSPTTTGRILTGGTALADNIATSGVDAAANADVIGQDIRIRRRYLQPTIVRGTSTVTAEIYCLLYNPLRGPVTQDTNVVIERNLAPTTGTV